MLATLVPIAFYTFIDRLPLEFMILEEMSNLFGGLGVYFVGSYSERRSLQLHFGRHAYFLSLSKVMALQSPNHLKDQ